MIEVFRMIITLILIPILIIILVGGAIYIIHESIWHNKKGEIDIK